MVLRSGHFLRAKKSPATETQPNLNQPTEIKNLAKNSSMRVCGCVGGVWVWAERLFHSGLHVDFISIPDAVGVQRPRAVFHLLGTKRSFLVQVEEQHVAG